MWYIPPAMETDDQFPPCKCCHSRTEFAANHCPQCHGLKTFNLSKLEDEHLIYFCESCGLTFDLRAIVLNYR